MGWKPESDAPEGVWIVTRRDGEDGMNVCHLRVLDGDREWCARDGRTTVTHHSFAAPTHWIYVNEMEDEAMVLEGKKPFNHRVVDRG